MAHQAGESINNSKETKMTAITKQGSHTDVTDEEWDDSLSTDAPVDEVEEVPTVTTVDPSAPKRRGRARMSDAEKAAAARKRDARKEFMNELMGLTPKGTHPITEEERDARIAEIEETVTDPSNRVTEISKVIAAYEQSQTGESEFSDEEKFEAVVQFGIKKKWNETTMEYFNFPEDLVNAILEGQAK